MIDEDFEDNDDDLFEDDFEYSAAFVGECTCSHPSEDHSWGHCGKDDCRCEAGWEE